jgi:hypothetical protein
MSSYKHNIKHFAEQITDKQKNKILLELIEWFKEQKWTSEDFVSYKRVKEDNELSILLHGNNLDIDNIIKTIKDTEFKDLNFKTYEQVSWKTNTYFIYFTII